MSEIAQELKRFAETTTIKGVSRTVKASRRTIRIFWISALISCFTVLLYQIATVLTNYYKYNVIRNSGVVIKYPDFPDVTVCNLFPLSDFSQLDGYPAYVKLVQSLKAISSGYLRTENASLFWNYVQSLHTFNIKTPVLAKPIVGDLVLRCQWYGWDLYSPKLCATSTRIVEPLQWCTTVHGGDSSLNRAAVSLLLYLNKRHTHAVDAFNAWLRYPLVNGVRVMVHPKGTLPNPLTAISVSSGTESSLFLEQTNYSQLSRPYGDCMDRDFLEPDVDNSAPYDYESCIGLCRQRQIVERCGCMDDNTLFTEAVFRLSNGTFCTNLTQNIVPDSEGRFDAADANRNFARTDCVWSFQANTSRCDCPPQCHGTDYEIRATSTKWPKLASQLAFYRMFLRNQSRFGDEFAAYEAIQTAVEAGNMSDDESLKELAKLRFIEENFLQVYVRFSEKKVHVVTEVPAITWDTLTSNLGGSLNLWLGISVPTIAELIELLYSLIAIRIQNKKQAIQPFVKGAFKNEQTVGK